MHKPTGPRYGTAADLPKFKSTNEQLAALESLATPMRGGRNSIELQNIQQLRIQIERITQTVDQFYEVLGPRNWIFHERLPLDEVGQLLEESFDTEEAQRRFLSIYADHQRLERWVHGSWFRDALYPYQRQLRRALDQFRWEEFDSCALTLITVMDGYVQQVDGRVGLHAQEPDGMGAWDSVVGHHMGLTHALKAYRRPIKRRRDEEVFELQRHGIVHGLIVNYDNRIVATKAWNMLLALVDWADAKEKEERAAEAEDRLSTTEVLEKANESDKRIARMKAWERRKIGSIEPLFGSLEAVQLTERFMRAWQSNNYGQIAALAHRMWYRDKTESWIAGEMRRNFSGKTLDQYEIAEADSTINNIWQVNGTATVNGAPGTFGCRWAVQMPDGWNGGPGDEGPWRLVNCEPQAWREA